MTKLIVWGMGKTQQKFRRYLDDEKAEIVAYTYNNAINKTEKKGGVSQIISPDDIASIEYDYVIVASSSWREIQNTLLQMGISEEKILQVYDREKYMQDDVIKQITQWNFTCSDHEYEIGNYKIDLGYGHRLSQYQREFPMYDCFLGELSKYLRNDRWSIDVGANVGDSVFLLRKHSNTKILAVEPVEEYYELLCRNVAQLENVFAESALITMDENAGYSLIEHDGTAYVKVEKDNVGENIKTLTMERLLEAKKIELEKIQLIKVDTDGFDAECIMSLGKSIERIQAFIYFENYYDNREVHDKYEIAYDFLDENGYKYFFIFDNFGNFLCEGDKSTVKAVNDYLLRGITGDSAQTMNYIDVMTVKEEQYGDAQRAVEEYMKMFDYVS